MGKQFRKYQSSLSVSSMAVITFGIWSIIKGIISTINSMKVDFSEYDNSAEIKTAIGIAIAIDLILICIEITLRLIIGLNGRSEAKGKKKGVVYLVIAVILTILSIFSFIMTIISMLSGSGPKVIDLIATVIVEGTSIFALIDVIVSAIQIKRMTKLFTKEQAMQSSGE